MRRPRIVVVGAGPAGGACALALARAGLEVELLDRARFPRPKACGSGLSPLALDVLGRLGVRDDFAGTHAEIGALRLAGPRGGRARLRLRETAWVVPRATLDHGIVVRAVAHGARFRDGCRVRALSTDDHGIVRGVTLADGTQLEADLVVCADGAHSTLAPERARSRPRIHAIVGWWRDATLPRDEALLVWDRRLHGYYAWAFPEPDGVHNLGLTIPADAPRASRLRALLAEILDEHFAAALEGAASVGRWRGHPARIGTHVGTVAVPGALWTGEAAGLVSPGTVEGIGFALESGVEAARFVVRELDVRAGLSRAQCGRYRAATERRVRGRFWAGEVFARIMRSPVGRGASRLVIGGGGTGVVERALARLVGRRSWG